MNKKKGFTLVELLAVIVILAVVVLIAVTAVIPRMNKARENAFIDEALVYMKGAKEAYISNETTECYNIADMGDLVKQNKSGYSGTVYVNEKGVSLNLTNGKYYLKTDYQPSKSDLVTTKPDKFVDTCSDTSKTYTISYDLDGGTVASANPTSYNPNSATFTLNNPTKSGYRFVGWSSKNLVNLYNRTAGNTSGGDNTTIRNLESNKYYVGLASNNYYNKSTIKNYTYGDNYWHLEVSTSGYGVAFPVNVNPNTTYNISNLSEGPIDIGMYSISGEKLNTKWAQGYSYSLIVPENCSLITVVLRPSRVNSNNNYEHRYYGVQLEQGTTATDYQEYLEPTTTAKIYRGSTGNKKFIANWEAL